MSGIGTVYPGTDTQPGFVAVSLSFTGTVSQIPGMTYPCSFTGAGSDVPVGGATGFVGPGAQCGPGVDLDGCPFELTPTTFKVVCPAMYLFMQASYLDANPTTRFTASGVML